MESYNDDDGAVNEVFVDEIGARGGGKSCGASGAEGKERIKKNTRIA